MRALYIICIVMSAAFAACGGKDSEVAVPRRTAYPRVHQYGAHYQHIDSVPLHILANSMAVTDVEMKNDGAYWLTIVYPEYKAKIYCTLTPTNVFDVQRVIDNRTERMLLNAGETPPETKEVVGRDGYVGALVETTAVSATPIQFVTVDTRNAEWVITGTVFLDGITPTTSADSIAPVIETLRRDVKTMLDSAGLAK